MAFRLSSRQPAASRPNRPGERAHCSQFPADRPFTGAERASALGSSAPASRRADLARPVSLDDAIEIVVTGLKEPHDVRVSDALAAIENGVAGLWCGVGLIGEWRLASTDLDEIAHSLDLLTIPKRVSARDDHRLAIS